MERGLADSGNADGEICSCAKDVGYYSQEENTMQISVNEINCVEGL